MRFFGEENFIGSFCVRSTPNARDYGHIGKMHEYCLFYSKDIDKAETFLLPDELKTFKYSDEISDFNIHPLYNSNESFHIDNRPNLYYPFYLNPGSIDEKTGFCDIYLDNKDGYVEIYPPKSVKNQVQFVWRWGKDKSLENLNKEIIGYKTSDNEYRIVQKMRTSSKVIRSILDSKKVSSRRGTAEVEELFKAKLFSFPKPTELIRTFIECSTNEDDILMDFFAGSGTTAHSSLIQSNMDNINRKFILVQLPASIEKTHIAYKTGYSNISELSKERIRRAIKTVDESQGFKVFKQENSTIYKWQDFVPDQDGILPDLFNNLEMAYKNPLQDGVTTQDFITEVLLQEGFPLTAKQDEVVSGIFKISHEWVPYTLYVTMLYSFKDTDFSKLKLQETDHFVCLDKAFEGNDALKQELDNQCKIFTI